MQFYKQCSRRFQAFERRYMKQVYNNILLFVVSRLVTFPLFCLRDTNNKWLQFFMDIGDDIKTQSEMNLGRGT